MKYLLACAVASLLPTIGYAQSCASVYQNAVHDVTVTTQDRSAKSFYFNLYCEESGETRSLDASASFSLPIKGIPLGISADGSWDQEEWKNFCKVGQEQGLYESSDFSFGSIVARDALASFNECVALEQRDLLITHDVTPPIGVSISGTIRSDKPVRILGLLHEEELITCTSNSFSEDGSEEVIGLGQAISGVDENFVISCLRKPQKANGTSFYPSTALTLGTSEGNYTVRLRNNQLLNFDLASEARAAYDSALAARNAALNAQTSAEAKAASLQGKIDSLRVKNHVVYVGDSNGWPAGNNGIVHRQGTFLRAGGCGTPVNANLAARLCGSLRALPVEPIGSINGGNCGHSLYVVSCVNQ